MPTYWSTTLIPTSRQVPAEAEVPSHQQMLRAGYIRKLGSGIYSYLPLGWRSLHKVSTIIRAEMDRAGAVEVFLPTLQPIELLERTGRRADYGDVLFVLKDRHGREQALGPTHEEVITDLVGDILESYKQLPITLYQIQTKFRDEFRPRFGVLRSREFQMKDAYSFDLTIAGLDRSYQAMYDAYHRIFDHCGLPYEVVEAESGPIGGSASHEFMVPSPTGEDLILKSDKGNYAANVEKCERAPRTENFSGEPTGALKEVHTPDCTSIDDLCANWKRFTGGKLKPEHVLKTLVFRVEGELTDSEKAKEQALKDKYRFSGGKFEFNWIAVLRGDHDLNESKFRQQVSVLHEREMNLVGKNVELGLMDEALAKEAGFEIGYVGPDAFRNLDAGEASRTYVLVDPDAAQSQFWVTGANKPEFHRTHFNWERDIDPQHETHRIFVADIRNAVDGDPSPKNDGGLLQTTRGIEIGHVFKLGTKYTEALGVDVLDENNQRVPLIMGCYGIGANRILAAAIEREGGHDENGIIWPTSIAPYAVLITPIKYEGAIKEAADRLAGNLEQVGLDVLLDDRVERPGVKFKDADLIGIPLRITIGEKGLSEGKVELKSRNGSNGPKGQLVPLEQTASQAAEMLKDL